MKREINPQESNRAEAFRMWMSSPMPMVTLVKTLDVSRLVKVSKKSGMKFTMLLHGYSLEGLFLSSSLKDRKSVV